MTKWTKDTWDRVNTWIGFLNLIVVGTIVGLVIVSLAGCATPAPPEGTKLIKRGCEQTEILVMTYESWSKRDQMAFDQARKTCYRKHPTEPCLTRFIRWEQNRYSAICGGDAHDLDYMEE